MSIICKLRNEPWSVVMELPINEFYSMIALQRYINDKERERVEKWRQRH